MARLRFPQDRTVFIHQGDYAAVLTPPRTGVQIFLDSACTQLANILDPDTNGTIVNSTVYTDDGLMDEFLGPDNISRLWVRVVGSTGAGRPVDATAASLVEEFGGSGGPISYTHTQSTPAAVWTVAHMLGRRPAAVSMFSADYGLQYDEFAVGHVDENNLTIVVDVPTAGVALIS